MAYWLRDAPTV